MTSKSLASSTKVPYIEIERLQNKVLKKYNINLQNIKRRSNRVLNKLSAERDGFKCIVSEPSCVKVKQTSTKNAESNSGQLILKPTYNQRRSIVNSEKSEYVVEDIRSVTIFDRMLRFEVKWLHWPEQYNTMEPLRNLNCPHVLNKFVDIEAAKYERELKILIDELAVGPMFSDDTLKEMLHLPEVKFDKIQLYCYLLVLKDIKQSKRSSYVLNKVLRLLQNKVFLDKRRSQINALSEWEMKMNEVDFKGKLRVVNNVDFEGPPLNFTYISQNIPVDGVVLSNDPPIACSCDPCSYKSHCCGKMHGSEYAYSCERRLKHTGIYLFECNKKCKCGPECTNRVVQRGRTNKLCIFKTSNGCGWGVKTDRHIRAGDFVCEYMGEVIKSDEAEQRGHLYDKMGVTYLFDLDHIINTSEAYTIDAYRYGNISHFINHSCEPNLCVVNVWIDCLDPNLSRLALFALQDIEKGQELSIDYKFSSNVSINENVISADDTYTHDNISNTFFETISNKILSHYLDSCDDSINDKSEQESVTILMGESITFPKENPRTPESKFMICKCGAKTCRKILKYF